MGGATPVCVVLDCLRKEAEQESKSCSSMSLLQFLPPDYCLSSTLNSLIGGLSPENCKMT